MSAYAGPNLTDSSLVLCLDTSNSKSYPGSGTILYDLGPNKLNFTVNASYVNSQGISSAASASSATTSLLNNDVHSVFFMIKFDSNATYPNGHSANWEKIFSFNAGGSDRSPGVWRYPSNRYIHWRYDPSNSGSDFSLTDSISYGPTGTEFSLNTWYYIGMVKSGATANSFVNGVKIGSQSVSNPKTAGDAAIILFQSYTLSSANMNCVHVYNRAVSDAEIQQNFNALRGRFGI